jgi:zinc/manganese transport system permease protein
MRVLYIQPRCKPFEFWLVLFSARGRTGFYVLFACVVTASVQIVGVYLVFTTLIVPAVAVYRMPARRSPARVALAFVSYTRGAGPVCHR